MLKAIWDFIWPFLLIALMVIVIMFELGIKTSTDRKGDYGRYHDDGDD